MTDLQGYQRELGFYGSLSLKTLGHVNVISIKHSVYKIVGFFFFNDIYCGFQQLTFGSNISRTYILFYIV